MKIDANSVTFEPQDMAFVKKFGILKATEMALDYHAEHPNLPFLYDAEQLAGFLGISRGELNDIVNHIQKEYKEAHLPKKDGTYRQPMRPQHQAALLSGPNQRKNSSTASCF